MRAITPPRFTTEESQRRWERETGRSGVTGLKKKGQRAPSRPSGVRYSRSVISRPRVGLTAVGRSGVNRTGNARSGQGFQVKRDADGGFYHVYGRGAKARRVKLSSGVAKSYGYR